MKIGILGTGHIGKTLIRELSAAGHDVKVANSRGPETIDPELLTSGARAVTTEDALRDVEAVILSIPLNAIPQIRSLIGGLSEETVLIDADLQRLIILRTPQVLALSHHIPKINECLNKAVSSLAPLTGATS